MANIANTDTIGASLISYKCLIWNMMIQVDTSVICLKYQVDISGS